MGSDLTQVQNQQRTFALISSKVSTGRMWAGEVPVKEEAGEESPPPTLEQLQAPAGGPGCLSTQEHLASPAALKS